MIHSFTQNVVVLFLSLTTTTSMILIVSGQTATTKPVISFCGGGSHSCVVFDTKQAKCWGSKYNLGILPSTNSTNYLGDTLDELGSNLPYTNVGTSITVEKVSCGTYHYCFKLDTGGLKCLGANDYGQIGLGLPTSTNPVGAVNGYTGDNLPSINLGTGIQVLDLALGQSHTCIKVTGNKVKCFGRNTSGQLGIGSTTDVGADASTMGDALPFVDLGTNVEITSIHSGPLALHNCVILSAPVAAVQKAKCWGNNNFSRLGYGTALSGNRGDAPGEMGDALPLLDLGTESRVKQIALGEGFTCMILFDDTLKCWGQGTYGAIGSGSTSLLRSVGTSLPVVAIDSGKNVKYLSAGYYHTCIVYDDLITVKCVGNNLQGQLGQGDTTQRGHTTTTTYPNIPAIDLGLGSLTIVSIYSGAYVNCVILSDDSIKCFGVNGNGQCANGLGSLDVSNPYSLIGDSPSDMGSNLISAILYSSSTTSITVNPTKSPTLKPTFVPTSSPSIAPSKAPTSLPTRRPTASPTKSPTKSPIKSTKSPTSNPTRKPTPIFFGANLSSFPGGTIPGFDLYLLIDATTHYQVIDSYCATFILMSGLSPSSCMDLIGDYAIEIVKTIANAVGGYYSNDLSKGLRVQASIIKCTGAEKSSVVETLFPLTGDSTLIVNSLQTVRTYTNFANPVACPLNGLYETIQKIENEWSNAANRPYRALITLTDGLLNDATGTTATAVVNAVSAIRYRCTPSIVVVPYLFTGADPNLSTQQTSIKIMAGNVDGNVFEAKIPAWITIPKIGERVSALLASSVVGNSRCYDTTSFSTVDKYWCGYNHPTVCTPRTSCLWSAVAPIGCSKDPSQSGCSFTTQSTCEANASCKGNTSTSKCTRKPEVPDCNAYFTSTLCATKSNFCSWNGSACVALSG